MYEYRITESATADLLMAEHAYLDYFLRLGDCGKGVAWAQDFFDSYRREIERMKVDPFRHPYCRVFPFDSLDTGYRSFIVGWFTVFYTVEEESFTVWAVKSSKSDFRNIDRE